MDESKKISIVFAKEAYERFQNLQKKAEVRTNTELVRNALRLYEWFLDKSKQNYKVQLVKDGEREVVELVM